MSLNVDNNIITSTSFCLGNKSYEQVFDNLQQFKLNNNILYYKLVCNDQRLNFELSSICHLVGKRLNSNHLTNMSMNPLSTTRQSGDKGWGYGQGQRALTSKAHQSPSTPNQYLGSAVNSRRVLLSQTKMSIQCVHRIHKDVYLLPHTSIYLSKILHLTLFMTVYSMNIDLLYIINNSYRYKWKILLQI